MRWRRAAAWLLAMQLMVAGSQVAHGADTTSTFKEAFGRRRVDSARI
jgi:hypothetical protein